jgi:fumarate hydratase class II
MPGKVNPVIAEALIQVTAQVVGNDAAIAAGAAESRFQLNTAMPLMARNLLESIRLLANAVTLFTEKLVRGIAADREVLEARNNRSLALATGLVPLVGYDRAAAIAVRAAAEDRTVREVALEEGVAAAAELDRLLDPRRQTGD